MLAGADDAEADVVARRVLAQFASPFTINMTNSVRRKRGYAVAPTDGSTLDELAQRRSRP
jgi:hypothetical protein